MWSRNRADGSYAGRFVTDDAGLDLDAIQPHAQQESDSLSAQVDV